MSMGGLRAHEQYLDDFDGKVDGCWWVKATVEVKHATHH